jgi:hypothetical protein
MDQFQEDVLAEIAVLNALALSALKKIALAEPNPKAYLAKLLEDGLANLAATNYWSVPDDRKEAFLENVQARYTDAVTSIRVD